MQIIHWCHLVVMISRFHSFIYPHPSFKHFNWHISLSNFSLLIISFFLRSFSCSILKHLPSIRPYQSYNVTDISWDDFWQECYMVTRLIFTLSNWGELSLDKKLFIHEYEFIHRCALWYTTIYTLVCTTRALLVSPTEVSEVCSERSDAVRDCKLHIRQTKGCT